MFCFNEFAFTVQVIHKINSTHILGFILICLYFTTGHLHTCTLQRMQPISLLILGSVFSDYVVFYGDYSERETLQMSGIGFVLDRFPFRALTPTKDNNSLATPFTDLWGKGYCDCFLPAHCSPVQVKSHEVGLLSFMQTFEFYGLKSHENFRHEWSQNGSTHWNLRNRTSFTNTHGTILWPLCRSACVSFNSLLP